MSQIDKHIKNEGNEWTEKAIFRRHNRKWLGYSRKIALRVLSAIEDNSTINQKKLAELLRVSPQHISKIVKGQENLTLKTISELSDVLGVELIAFPDFKYNNQVSPINEITSNITWTYYELPPSFLNLLHTHPLSDLTNSSQISHLNVSTD